MLKSKIRCLKDTFSFNIFAIQCLSIQSFESKMSYGRGRGEGHKSVTNYLFAWSFVKRLVRLIPVRSPCSVEVRREELERE